MDELTIGAAIERELITTMLCGYLDSLTGEMKDAKTKHQRAKIKNYADAIAWVAGQINDGGSIMDQEDEEAA